VLALLHVTQFPSPLGKLPRDVYRDLLAPAPAAQSGEQREVRTAIRDLLRHGGYKPTGRGKPASEYLVRAAAEGKLGPINAAVDVGNVVSLPRVYPSAWWTWSASGPRPGGPRARRHPLRLQRLRPGDRPRGLLCLFDADGPCANAVKDSTRTKTSDQTTTTLTLVWGALAAGDLVDEAVGWAWELLGRVGATVDLVELISA
jgi:DNA/RNA-binding domain of Phe-tRNA-synthetase-like protein